MKTNDIIDIFVAFSQKPGGKTKPVLVIKLAKNKAWLLKITSKYVNKSDQIRKFYYPIFNWCNYGLSKKSFIDTKNYLIADYDQIKLAKVRGHFSKEDLRSLKKFIDQVYSAQNK